MKLITCNIEGDNHLDRIIPFVQKEEPDVVCFQEMLNVNQSLFETEFKMKAYYIPLLSFPKENRIRMRPNTNHGISILSKHPFQQTDTFFYFRSEREVPDFIEGKPNSGRRALLKAVFKIGDKTYNIITTHFIWSPQGSATPLQKECMNKVLNYLEKEHDFIICGDFNAHRENETWHMLSSRYQDNLPPETKTTVDGKLHRKGNLMLAVDGLFSTPGYKVSNVKVVDGVSDHMAIVADISKAS